MLYDGLGKGFAGALDNAKAHGANVLAEAPAGSSSGAAARPTLLRAEAASFLKDPSLREEMFGPSSMIVAARDAAELVRLAEALEGQLTATIHGEPAELEEHRELVEVLKRKAGRLVFNGFPTGVEVGHAMHHGGPYPASTDSRTTSVGSAAIVRFARAVCWQDFPDAALPGALKNGNALGIWRMVNGKLTKDDV
jgi:NADP-dependent aldehyde dehydrogenase